MSEEERQELLAKLRSLAEAAKIMTRAQARAVLVNEGYTDQFGNLTPAYGGPQLHALTAQPMAPTASEPAITANHSLTAMTPKYSSILSIGAFLLTFQSRGFNSGDGPNSAVRLSIGKPTVAQAIGLGNARNGCRQFKGRPEQSRRPYFVSRTKGAGPHV